MFRFAYFALSSSDMIDAMFEVNLDISQQEAAFTSSIPVFKGDMTKLVEFSLLLPIPMTTRVLTTDLVAIQTAVQTAWRLASLPGVDLTQLMIKVMSQQEEYLDMTSENIVYSIMYSASLNGEVLDPLELPEINTATVFAAITNMNGAGIFRYVISTAPLSSLRRFKAAMSVYLNKWVIRSDKTRMMQAVQNELRTKITGVTTEYGVQEEYYDISQKTNMIKLSFFASLNSKMLKSFYEASVDITALTSRLQTLGLEYTLMNMQTVSMMNVRNLRNSYKLLIDGGVAMGDMTKFSTAISQSWSPSVGTVTVNLVYRKDMIGERE